MKFMSAFATDKGNRKEKNEDSLLLKVAGTSYGNVTFAVVSDGMGGLRKGELASKQVILIAEKWFQKEFVSMLETGFSREQLEKDWLHMVEKSNRILLEYGARNNCRLGTTITAILLTDNSYYVLHVGDTRLYKITSKVELLTRNHSLVQKEFEAGKITPEEAKKDSRKNILLQAIGAVDVVIPDFFDGEVKEDETYLLCSDGFYNKLIEKEIQEYLQPDALKSEEIMEENLHCMIQTVLSRQEKDNISAIAIKTF